MHPTRWWEPVFEKYGQLLCLDGVLVVRNVYTLTGTSIGHPTILSVVEELSTLLVPFIEDLRPALRALCTKLNVRLLYYKRTVNLDDLLAPSRPAMDRMQQKNVVHKVFCEQFEVSYWSDQNSTSH